MLLAVCFAVTASLLWLAAGVAARAESRSRLLSLALRGSAVLLAACALWWPPHLLQAEGTLAAAAGPRAMLGWLPVLGLALLALATARAAAARAVAGALAGGVATLVLSYAFVMLMLPGLFNIVAPLGRVAGEGLPLVLLALALVVLFLPSRRASGFGAALRAGGTLAAAGVVVLALLPALHQPVPAAAWHELAVLAVLGALAGVLCAVLGPGAESDGRVSSAAPRALRGGPTTDALTGLPMRQFFEERLASAARRCESKKQRMAVLFIDLDGFKPVNDTYGHAVGDRVLEQVGIRLRSIARAADVAARVGGDEFLMLLPGVSSQDSVARVAKALIELLSRPYKVDEREVNISCSVGVALYPDGCKPNKLVPRADAAMYAAKRAGGTRHAFFLPEMDHDAKQNFELARDLRRALANNELELYFQPKVDARSGQVTAAEALLRWNHPRLGVVMPDEFITLAERSGQIGAMGDWVIEAACKQARAWRDKGLRMRVAINLSAHQMRQDDIADRITEALERHKIRPSLLTCEITESTAMEDTRATQQTFRRLGEMGVHLSIDDFGTGHSSLAYLRKLPAEELKIDRMFVQDLEHSADARAVVDAVVKLAHALGLKVVAEGVENPRQHHILAEMGCDELQGYLFARPMTARALLLWALGDRGEAAAFRNSLFGETRQASRLTPLPASREMREARQAPEARKVA
ncbi:putative bifunctional diguanylate cyclase/phosphodiesterase [Piscinibacter sp.]|uniref:putative bifunctional diguanylate cyclase/phosphodiesterase n=1 Tax=Piscinibacter sp. TaxID=1903157 RepID=UPI0039E3A000